MDQNEHLIKGNIIDVEFIITEFLPPTGALAQAGSSPEPFVHIRKYARAEHRTRCASSFVMDMSTRYDMTRHDTTRHDTPSLFDGKRKNIAGRIIIHDKLVH